MDKPTALKNLNVTLTAFERSAVPENGIRDTAEFYNLNAAIRRGLEALGENAMDVETLENRGLFTGSFDEPIPDTYLPGVRQLIADLEAS